MKANFQIPGWVSYKMVLAPAEIRLQQGKIRIRKANIDPGSSWGAELETQAPRPLIEKKAFRLC